MTCMHALLSILDEGAVRAVIDAVLMTRGVDMGRGCAADEQSERDAAEKGKEETDKRQTINGFGIQ